MYRSRHLLSAVLPAALLPFGVARAEVTPHALFCDGAVLQRDTEVPVWGFSKKEGEKVSVTLDNKPAVVTEVKNGKWMVKLPANPAGGPHTLKIAGDNTVELKDILFGEVWICSGQSNMEMSFSNNYNVNIPDADEQMKASALPGLRFFNVQNAVSPTPRENVSGKWQQAAPETARVFSLTGQYFGRELKKALGDVPVGLIESDWGGTRAEAWMSRTGLAKSPTLATELAKFDKAQKDYSERLTKFNAEKDTLMAAHAEAVAKAKADNQAEPPAPKAPGAPAFNQNSLAALHNAMITPLVPYAFRGVIWYQGESNNSRAKDYRATFPALIADWREEWNRGDFPFLFVQIAPYKDMTPELREAQFLSLKTAPNTAMVQSIDVGEAGNIHPWNKEPIGKRLALAARNLVYGEKKLEYSGPLFAGATFSFGKATVTFTHASTGLILKNVKDGDFQIAGADKQFKPATAKIELGKLVVSSPEVATPTAVRYGWSNVPNASLWNKEGLPASPFRSDVE